MIFNLLKFDFNSNKTYNEVTSDDTTHKCSYLTPEQFRLDPKASSGKLNLLNVNIKSLSKKKIDSLKECLKSLDCEFALFGVSETHFKNKPNKVILFTGSMLNIPTELVVIRLVCACIYLIKLKYKLRTNLCKATSNYVCLRY